MRKQSFIKIVFKVLHSEMSYYNLYAFICLIWVLVLSIFAFIDFESLIKIFEVLLTTDGEITHRTGAFFKVILGPFLIFLFLIIPKIMRKRHVVVNFIPWYTAFFLGHFLIFTHLNILFHPGVSEDGLLEQMTVILSFLASSLFFISGIRGCKFAFFLSASWFIFAMEEMSWGQRIFDLRTPIFFIEHNYQQEINFHNFFNPYFEVIYLIFNFLLLSFFTWFSELKLFSKFYNLPSVSMVVRISDRYSIWIIPLSMIPGQLALGTEFVEQQWSLMGVLLSYLLFERVKKNLSVIGK